MSTVLVTIWLVRVFSVTATMFLGISSTGASTREPTDPRVIRYATMDTSCSCSDFLRLVALVVSAFEEAAPDEVCASDEAAALAAFSAFAPAAHPAMVKNAAATYVWTALPRRPLGFSLFCFMLDSPASARTRVPRRRELNAVYRCPVYWNDNDTIIDEQFCACKADVELLGCLSCVVPHDTGAAWCSNGLYLFVYQQVISTGISGGMLSSVLLGLAGPALGGSRPSAPLGRLESYKLTMPSE